LSQAKGFYKEERHHAARESDNSSNDSVNERQCVLGLLFSAFKNGPLLRWEIHRGDSGKKEVR